jgi:hypothetical protein
MEMMSRHQMNPMITLMKMINLKKPVITSMKMNPHMVKMRIKLHTMMEKLDRKKP